jgi:nitrite reductase/ring-hydroxylating ferredoxin subunit
MGGSNELKGPDLAQGVPVADLADGGTLVGHASGEAVLLARKGDEIFAVGASCTHYGGALADGIVEGDTVRCPLHHACFSLRTGEALRAPALNPIPCFDVQKREGKLYVLGKSSDRSPSSSATATGLSNVVIVGGGAAGQAAAEMLRRRGYVGKITMLSADDAPPCDRPNLSKDYLAGNAPEEWIPLRPPEFFQVNGIELVLN